MLCIYHVRSLGAIVGRGTATSLTLLAVASLFAGRAEAKEAQNPPRYQFKVGQRLEYHDDNESARENSQKTEQHFKLICWVVRENPDQSWRLMFQNSEQGGEGNSHDEYGYFDLSADGRVARSKGFVRLQPEKFFPKLPDNPLTGETEWSFTTSDEWSKYLYKAAAPAADASTWALEGRLEEPWDPIYLLTRTFSHVFDLDRGLVRSAQSRSEQHYGINSTSTGKRELASSEQLPEAEVEQLSKEAAIWFRAMDEVQPLLDDADRDPKRTVELLDNAEAVLAKLEGQFQLPMFQSLLTTQRELRKRERDYQVESSGLAAKQLNLPSADWQTTDWDGHSYALKDLRGKVVVLDFWYRGCGWCMRAMPQMKQLADDFKDRPVAILGMNNDQVEADARLVIDVFKLPYPTLKNRTKSDGEGIAAQYSVQGYPTVVVIDQQGIVRRFHVGYSTTLRSELTAEISKLLAQDDAAATAPASAVDRGLSPK